MATGSGSAANTAGGTTRSRPHSPSSSRGAMRSSPTQVVSGFATPARRSVPKVVPRSQGATSQGATSRSTTPSSSAPSSRPSSLVLDPTAYRYSLNVGGISRFPANTGGSGAKEVLRATRTAPKDDAIDPSRASVSSDASSSRLSSRYTAEEVAPQRRPVYLALPADPGAVGPWSNTSSTLVAGNKDGKDGRDGRDSKAADPPRRNSKIMTTFPFPHPTTPHRRANADDSTSPRAHRGFAAAWQRLLTAIFAGPYERQLNREEQQDDRITQTIIDDIARRNHTASTKSYGSITPATTDSDDPYGYRQLAGPQLLPTYTTDLVARRRERRRARSRARFQCMALWTIWTVSIVLVLIVGVLVFSFVFPDRLDIPNRSDEGEAVTMWATLIKDSRAVVSAHRCGADWLRDVLHIRQIPTQ